MSTLFYVVLDLSNVNVSDLWVIFDQQIVCAVCIEVV